MSEPRSTVSEAPAPLSGKRRLKDAAIALSLANLLFIQSWFGLLFSEDLGYYNKIPVNTAALLALGMNLLGFAALFWFALVRVRRTRHRWLKIAARVGLCALMLVPLNFARLELLGVRGTEMISFLKSPLGFALGVVTMAAVLRWSRLAARSATMAVVVFLPLAALTLGHITLAVIHPPPPFPDRLAATPLPAGITPPTARVLWIIFDELDQRIVFTQRPPGVALPELDRLRRQSLYAPNAYPPAGNTRLSLPALTTGRPVAETRPIGASDLRLTFADTRQEGAWSEQPTVFSQARALGVRGALVGWYHPYARIFGASLDYCEWYPYPPFEQARDWTLAASMIHQICATLSPLQQRRLQVRLYENSRRDALTFATNAALGLTFLHLPVPHVPGIYAPAQRRLTMWNLSRTQGYVDNLALADRTLGDLRQAMEQAGLWDKTWVLISSDHWWRESARYDGRTDHRVPFLLKPAEATGTLDYPPAFNTILSADLLLAILKGEVTRAGQLVPWLDAHRVKPPASYPEAGEP